MRKIYIGVFLLLLSALGFGLLPIFALYAYKGNITITTLLLIRFSTASVLLFIYVFIKYRKISLSKKDLFFLFILGAVGYNLQSRFYFSSVKYISPSLAALILYTYPMFVTGLSFFIDKEKITGKTAGAIGISFIGIVMILGTSFKSVDMLGILFALGASIVYSLYIILGNRVIKSIPSAITSAFICLFSAIAMLTVGLFTSDISFNFTTITWLPILGLALFSTVVAILFFFLGMELLGPSKASIISMTEPVFTVLFSVVLLQDILSAAQLVGGAIVLAGSMLVIWSKEPKNIVKEDALCRRNLE
jgi:drug/metabolite transporter (DMT)-like permease